MCPSGSSGKLAARTTTALSALASRLTAALAPFVIVPDLGSGERDEKAKMIPSGGSIPGEMALNERARSPTARTVTTV